MNTEYPILNFEGILLLYWLFDIPYSGPPINGSLIARMLELGSPSG